MDGGQDSGEAALRAAGEAYCIALQDADIGVLEALFHENCHLYALGAEGLVDWPRERFLDRVRERGSAGERMAFRVLSAETSGPAMGRVHLEVAVPGRHFVDYLDFLKFDDGWRVIAKVFRVAEGPAV